MAVRLCCQCGNEKELTADNFYRRSARPDGFTYSCKTCVNAKKAWAKRDPEKYRESLRRFFRSDKGRKWAFRAKLRRYGLTEEQYNYLLAAQDGKCAVCGKPIDVPFVDHSHATGKTRGILHGTCNSVIGFASDDVSVLRGAIAYLERHREQ